MYKKLTLAIILLTFKSYSQQYLDLIKKINENETFSMNIDDVHDNIMHRTNENLVIFHGFYFDSDKLHQKSIYDCLPNFNPQRFLFHFQIYNGDLNLISLKKQIKSKENKEDIKHSALYIFSRKDAVISEFLKANLAEFSISLQENYRGMNIYKLEYISSQEEFCFRLNQIHSHIENELQNISKLENQKQPIRFFFSLGLNSSYGIWSNNESYTNDNFTTSRSINPSFFELGISSRLNMNNSLFVDLCFSQSKFGITAAIDDGQYAIPIDHDFLNERIISFENLEEQASFTLNSFGLGLGYNFELEELFGKFKEFLKKPKKSRETPDRKTTNKSTGKLSLLLSCNARYYLPTTFSSELIDGNFSYRGKSAFISQELENINDLNLSNNVNHSFYQRSVSQINGFALYPSLQINYAISNFTLHAGLNYLLNFWNVRNPTNADYVSSLANEYYSTFMLSEGINNSILNLSFGVSYAIK